jgi:hypothetical protein
MLGEENEFRGEVTTFRKTQRTPGNSREGLRYQRGPFRFGHSTPSRGVTQVSFFPH